MNSLVYKRYLKDSVRDWKFLSLWVLYILVLLGFLFITVQTDVFVTDENLAEDLQEQFQRDYGDLRIILPFAFTLGLLPFLVLFTTGVNLSSSIRNGYYRYLITRLQRETLYVSRWAADATIVAVGSVLAYFAFLIYALIQTQAAVPQVYFTIILPAIQLTIFSGSLVALYQALNTFAKPYTKTLVLCFTGMLVALLLLASDYTKYASFLFYFVDFDNDSLLIAHLKLFGQLLWLLLFVYVGTRLFRRSDL